LVITFKGKDNEGYQNRLKGGGYLFPGERTRTVRV